MERDDLIVNDSYSINARHSEEDGKKIRKKLYFVTVLLTVITIIEIFMGVAFKRNATFTWEAIKLTFVILTLVKAAYIVLVFMHLGDERKNLKYVVLLPYALFILYLLFIALYEGLSAQTLHNMFG
ncbi:MAG: cytochrome C oxidase subunit IV family protein [Flavobacteriales bacterium]|nr:cytochrome C oxidase subunit IV family protein [Flavobacteriales bacterium]